MSVVIPTHERASTIVRAVVSALDQTYAVKEVIVVDDASSDGTEAIVASIDDPRVRYVRRGDRGGASAARNSGIDASNSDVIAFLDSDDVWRPQKLEVQIAALNDQGPPIGLVVCGFTVHRGRGLRSGWADDRSLNRPDRYYRLRHGDLVTSCFLIPRFVFDGGIRFDEDLPALEDYDLALQILRRYRITTVHERLVDKAVSGDRLYAGRTISMARERLIRKYLPELRVRPGALARHYRRLAIAHAATSDLEKAEESLHMAHRCAPLRPATWAMRLAMPLGAGPLIAVGRWTVRIESFSFRLITTRIEDLTAHDPSSSYREVVVDDPPM